ncbi:amino acid ABC transporter permease [Labedella phragmitis]|uniref:Amino acid ABC transporter permease n=2 Tax=Labedella TaxID=390250 RepID=A0A3S4BQE3_9MICO|nr:MULTISPECIES: amino acid ABC transporter permease [Labedella]RWZ46058.1 amino acid ABC transporter permease [Labedella phragmitis]RWZ54828.1 amino acid ABC transporter permease [Labedella populi]
MAEAFLLIAAATGATLLLTVSAALIGIVLGAPLVLLAQSRSAILRGIYTVFVHVVRGVPALVWLFIAFFGLAELGIVLPALASAVLTLGIIAIATMAEIYRGGLAAIRQGQYEAGWALSLGRWSLAKDIIFPQLFRAVSPTTATYIVGLLKDSALASIIGVPEIVYVTGLEVQSLGHGLELFLFAGLIYLALSIPLGVVSRVIHVRLTRRYAVL